MFALIFVIVNNALMKWGIIVSYYTVDHDSASKLIIASLGYVVGTMAIVIPVLILIVQFIVNDQNTASISDVYIDKTRIRHTINYALVWLAAHIIFMIPIELKMINGSEILFYILVGFAIFDLVLAYEIAAAIKNIKQTLSWDFVFRTLLEEISNALDYAIEEEARYRLTRKTHFEQLQAHNLSSSINNKILSIRSMKPVLAKKTGYIADVRLGKLKKLSILQENDTTHPQIVMTKFATELINKNEPIGYVAQEIPLAKAAKLMSGSLDIRTRKISTNEFPKLLDPLKEIARRSIIDANLTQFEETLRVYGSILSKSYSVNLPETHEWLSQSFGWSGHRSITSDLDELIGEATQQSNVRFIHQIASLIQQISAMIIHSNSDKADEYLRQMVERYLVIYRECGKGQSIEFVSRSYIFIAEFADSLLLSDLMKLLKNSLSSSEKVKQAETKIHIVYNVLQRLVYESFIIRDWSTLNTLLKISQPQECLNYLDYHLRAGGSEQIEDEQERLEFEGSNPSIAHLTAMEGLSIAKEIPSKIENAHIRLTILVYAAALERYNLGELSLEDTKEVAGKIKPYLPEYKQLLHSLSQWLESAFSDPIMSLFTLTPETNRSYFLDYYGKLNWLYAIYGIENIDELEKEGKLAYPTEGFIENLERWNQSIASSPEKWCKLLGFDKNEIKDRSGRFLALNEKSQDNLSLAKIKSVAVSSLDESKLNKIKEDITSNVTSVSVIQKRVLNENHSSDGDNTVIGNEIPVTINYKTSKNYWIQESDPITGLYSTLPQQLIGCLQVEFDRLAAHKLLKMACLCPSNAALQTIEMYMDAALEQLSTQGFEADCILIPQHLKLGEFSFFRESLEKTIESSSRFSNNGDLESHQGFQGMWDDSIVIAQYNCSFEKHPYILVANLANAVDVKLTDVQLEINDISDEDKAKISKAQSYDQSLEKLLNIQI